MVLWVCEGVKVSGCGSGGDVEREGAAASGSAPAAVELLSGLQCALGHAGKRLCSRSPGKRMFTA